MNLVRVSLPKFPATSRTTWVAWPDPAAFSAPGSRKIAVDWECVAFSAQRRADVPYQLGATRDQAFAQEP
jgi:hypothetical protein